MTLAALHLVAAALYLGGTLTLGAAVLPAFRGEGDAGRRATLARILRVAHPVSLASLGILVLTGAGGVTALKEAYGAQFAARWFGPLGLKLLLVFILLLVASYEFFGLGLRLTRAAAREAAGEEGLAPEVHARLVARLQSVALANGLLGAAASILGLVLARG
jgi:uncharacterized membrane protein